MGWSARMCRIFVMRVGHPRCLFSSEYIHFMWAPCASAISWFRLVDGALHPGCALRLQGLPYASWLRWQCALALQ